MSFGKPNQRRRFRGRALGFGAVVLTILVAVPAPRARAAGRAVSGAGPAPTTGPATPRTRQGQKKRRTKKEGRATPGKGARAGGKSATNDAANASAATSSSDGLPFAIGRSSKVTANQSGRIVVFPFRGDDDGALSRQVGQLLAARGLDVMTDVKPVDSAEQFRDMAAALHLVGYVDGEVRGSDASARAIVRVRSGYSGRKVVEVSFKETRDNLPRELSDRLWARVGPSVAHACTDAGKPRKKSRTTLEINAGSPIETVPAAPRPRPSSSPAANKTPDAKAHGTSKPAPQASVEGA